MTECRREKRATHPWRDAIHLLADCSDPPAGCDPDAGRNERGVASRSGGLQPPTTWCGCGTPGCGEDRARKEAITQRAKTLKPSGGDAVHTPALNSNDNHSPVGTTGWMTACSCSCWIAAFTTFVCACRNSVSTPSSWRAWRLPAPIVGGTSSSTTATTDCPPQPWCSFRLRWQTADWIQPEGGIGEFRCRHQSECERLSRGNHGPFVGSARSVCAMVSVLKAFQAKYPRQVICGTTIVQQINAATVYIGQSESVPNAPTVHENGDVRQGYIDPETRRFVLTNPVARLAPNGAVEVLVSCEPVEHLTRVVQALHKLRQLGIDDDNGETEKYLPHSLCGVTIHLYNNPQVVYGDCLTTAVLAYIHMPNTGCVGFVVAQSARASGISAFLLLLDFTVDCQREITSCQVDQTLRLLLQTQVSTGGKPPAVVL